MAAAHHDENLIEVPITLRRIETLSEESPIEMKQGVQ